MSQNNNGGCYSFMPEGSHEDPWATIDPRHLQAGYVSPRPAQPRLDRVDMAPHRAELREQLAGQTGTYSGKGKARLIENPLPTGTPMIPSQSGMPAGSRARPADTVSAVQQPPAGDYYSPTSDPQAQSQLGVSGQMGLQPPTDPFSGLEQTMADASYGAVNDNQALPQPGMSGPFDLSLRPAGSFPGYQQPIPAAAFGVPSYPPAPPQPGMLDDIALHQQMPLDTISGVQEPLVDAHYGAASYPQAPSQLERQEQIDLLGRATDFLSWAQQPMVSEHSSPATYSQAPSQLGRQEQLALPLRPAGSFPGFQQHRTDAAFGAPTYTPAAPQPGMQHQHPLPPFPARPFDKWQPPISGSSALLDDAFMAPSQPEMPSQEAMGTYPSSGHFPCGQQQTAGPAYPVADPSMAAQQPGMMMPAGRSSIWAPGAFSGVPRAAGPLHGIGAPLAPVSDEERERITAVREAEMEKKKREKQQRRERKQRRDSAVASSSSSPSSSSANTTTNAAPSAANRMVGRTATGNQASHAWALRTHLSRCSEKDGCGDDCVYWQNWPELWAKKAATPYDGRLNGEIRHTCELWVGKYKNLSGWGDKGRKPKGAGGRKPKKPKE